MVVTVAGAKAKFHELDKDKTGQWGLDQMCEFLRRGDPSITERAVQLIFAQVDKTNTGTVSANEFVDYICNFSQGWRPMKDVNSVGEIGGWIAVPICEQIVTSGTAFVAAVDGSEFSMAMLDYLADGLLWQNRNSTLNVIHIYDVSKSYLPPRLRSDAVKEHVETKLTSSLSAKRFKLTWIPKDKNKAGSRIAERASADAADFICVGFMGLKGKKDNKLYGSNTYELLKRAKCSVMVIKDESSDLLPMRRPCIFVVSVSLNQASTKAFLDALRLSKPGDEIHVAYCAGFLERQKNIYTKELQAKYEAFFGSFADGSSKVFKTFQDRDCSFHLITQQISESVPQAIVRYADEVKADFIVVGTNALRVERGKEPVGSVSLQICMETERNFVVSRWIE